MKKFLLATAAAVAIAAPAQAADLPVKAPPAAVVVVSTWSGFYVGGNVGAHWLRNGGFSSVPADAATTAFWAACTAAVTCPGTLGRGSGFGVIGGGQIGFNWQVSNVVFGVEADIQGSSVRADSRLFQANTGTAFVDYTLTGRTEVNWL